MFVVIFNKYSFSNLPRYWCPSHLKPPILQMSGRSKYANEAGKLSFLVRPCHILRQKYNGGKSAQIVSYMHFSKFQNMHFSRVQNIHLPSQPCQGPRHRSNQSNIILVLDSCNNICKTIPKFQGRHKQAE